MQKKILLVGAAITLLFATLPTLAMNQEKKEAKKPFVAALFKKEDDQTSMFNAVVDLEEFQYNFVHPSGLKKIKKFTNVSLPLTILAPLGYGLKKRNLKASLILGSTWAVATAFYHALIRPSLNAEIKDHKQAKNHLEQTGKKLLEVKTDFGTYTKTSDTYKSLKYQAGFLKALLARPTVQNYSDFKNYVATVNKKLEPVKKIVKKNDGVDTIAPAHDSLAEYVYIINIPTTN